MPLQQEYIEDQSITQQKRENIGKISTVPFPKEKPELIKLLRSDQYEHKLEYVGFARSWERLVLRGSYDSRKFLAFYLTQGILQAAFGLNRGDDPELEADAELRACQDLIRPRIRLSEPALADDRVDLRSFVQ